jgi:uncharacterized protein (TIGR02646 family)
VATEGWQKLLDVVRSALVRMTASHCAYCDCQPVEEHGAEVDHFRPIGRIGFRSLVTTWENLFPACHVCNHEKGSQWDELLLAPDQPGFSFLRYFSFRSDRGELEPNAAATPEDQVRAAVTIKILKLNRPAACENRKRALHRLQPNTETPLDDVPYRFLHA